MTDYYVEIVNATTREAIKRIGPLSERAAERVERGVLLNLGDNYFTRIVPVVKKASRQSHPRTTR